jgi:hypothetical protein
VTRVRASLTKSVMANRLAGFFPFYISTRALYVLTKVVLYFFFNFLIKVVLKVHFNASKVYRGKGISYI